MNQANITFNILAFRIQTNANSSKQNTFASLESTNTEHVHEYNKTYTHPRTSSVSARTMAAAASSLAVRFNAGDALASGSVSFAAASATCAAAACTCASAAGDINATASRDDANAECSAKCDCDSRRSRAADSALGVGFQIGESDEPIISTNK